MTLFCIPGTVEDWIRTWWSWSTGPGEKSFWRHLRPEGNDERRRTINLKIGELVLISTQSVASGTSGRSFSMSGWTGSCYPSEQKGPESHPPNNTTVPVELRWPARVRDLERRVGHAINLNLFVICKHQATKSFVSTWKSALSVLLLEASIE